MTTKSVHHGAAFKEWYTNKHGNRNQFVVYIQSQMPDGVDVDSQFNKLIHLCRQLEGQERFFPKHEERFQEAAGQYIGVSLLDTLNNIKPSVTGGTLIDVEKKYHKEAGRAEAWEEAFKHLTGEVGNALKLIAEKA